MPQTISHTIAHPCRHSARVYVYISAWQREFFFLRDLRSTAIRERGPRRLRCLTSVLYANKATSVCLAVGRIFSPLRARNSSSSFLTLAGSASRFRRNSAENRLSPIAIVLVLSALRNRPEPRAAEESGETPAVRNRTMAALFPRDFPREIFLRKRRKGTRQGLFRRDSRGEMLPYG